MKKNFGVTIGSERFQILYEKHYLMSWSISWIYCRKLQNHSGNPHMILLSEDLKKKLHTSYFVRIFPKIEENLKQLEHVICFTFKLAITGGHIYSDFEWIHLSLPARFAGLSIHYYLN